METREHATSTGRRPSGEWFAALDSNAAANVVAALGRLGMGNTSNVESVGAGVYEDELNVGPGDRISFGVDGSTLVILLGGGTKKRQQKDIRAARACWQDFQARKQGGG